MTDITAPREFWLRFDMNGNLPVVYGSPTEPITDDGFVIHVREVIPPPPRTIYLCEVHGTRTVFDTAIAATREALEYQHGEARVTEFVEVLK